MGGSLSNRSSPVVAYIAGFDDNMAFYVHPVARIADEIHVQLFLHLWDSVDIACTVRSLRWRVRRCCVPCQGSGFASTTYQLQGSLFARGKLMFGDVRIPVSLSAGFTELWLRTNHAFAD